ncbi:MAG: hypothetical protein CVV44_06555 [Spirochaetae bacterium HGW-Spirochaetae-1]|jgi:MoaA/NifB/PqqE/SkfB family radical SAM enzyme|nr:MAG: hypothetical protein CVV44_06555 [Spirochaetae bacterium HGW-Spirochaetae-1]
MNRIRHNLTGEAVSIEISTRCNSSCSHCFARAGRGRDFSLDHDTAAAILREAFTLGYHRLHITGGEPFLYESILELLDEAFSTGYETVFINTNGTLLSDSLCSVLAGYGPGLSLSVSLQGPRELHDTVRGPGSWDRAAAGIGNLLNRSIKTAVYTATGRSLLPGLSRFVADIFKRFSAIEYLAFIQMIRVAGDALDLSREVLRPEDFISLVKTTALLDLGGYGVTILENPLAAVTARCLGMPWLPVEPHLHRSGRLVIMADRNVTLAHSTRESFGEYRRGLLEEILVSGEYDTAVGPDEKTCPSCRHNDLCVKCGLVRPSEWYRDMNPEIPYCMRVMDLACAETVSDTQGES